jgi:hypothetical protein
LFEEVQIVSERSQVLNRENQEDLIVKFTKYHGDVRAKSGEKGEGRRGEEK